VGKEGRKKSSSVENASREKGKGAKGEENHLYNTVEMRRKLWGGEEKAGFL